MKEINAELLQIFACPACHGRFRQQGRKPVCGGCRLAHPVLDGIPLLL